MKIEEILAVKHLSVEFQTPDGKKQVVKDVSLSLRQGEVLALVGESGCGKTVLCRSILKLLPKSASVTGEAVQYKDQNLIRYNEKEMQQIRGQGIAMVFQDPQGTLNPTMTVGSQIEEAILLHENALKQKKREKDFEKNKKKSAKERAIELMELVGIKDAEQRYDLYPYHFSGGMRQRCVLAIALASNPKLLIADEPTTALDVTIQAEILKLLKKLQKELNLSILFITHDLGVVAQIANRVAVMQNGNIVEFEEAKQLFTAPKHSYTKKLLHDHPYYMHRNESELISESELHEKLVEISHLSYAYPLDRKRVFQAVKDVSFEIRRDEIFGLVGESGSGKSTVGKCLMGILSPEAETLSYDGINLLDKKAKKKNARRLQKERQMIFQDSTSSLNQKIKVEKILAEPLEIHKVFSDKKEQHDFLCEMMEEVELQEEQLHVWPPELSGGQRQRVAIARAFAMKPKLLIADEPIASLDVTTQAQMVKLFRHLQREHDCAILFIAHDLSMVRLLCDRVGVMKDGKLVEIGETEQVFGHPQHLYTKKLLEAIPIPEISGEEQSDEETMA
ncbi:ABC transporter ATP-binding protein [Ruminococcus sp. OM08-13AT]|nr:ABC transporter ATP-binding protein [Ruminococcus sp. OM08-13AT]RGI56137.1 ABC transporter ATP-binding protein [Ruminococcus sp. OF05-2BH]